MPSIVTVNVTQTVAPAPNKLQKTGAFVSQGATVLAAGTAGLLTQLSDLTTLLVTAQAISSLSWSNFQVSAITPVGHGYPVGQTIWLTVAGVVPSGYNGTFLATITGSSTFTYPLGNNPGTETVPGTVVVGSADEVQQMANTFFAQGVNLAVYVLELGPGGPSAGIAALTAYLIQNPNSMYTPGATGFFYAYLIPRTWDGNNDLLNLVQEYESATARTYFWITTTLSNYGQYTDLEKSVFAFIESPDVEVYPANVLTGITWSGGVVTATTTVAHGVLPGTWFQIQGCVPTGYNGYWLALPGTVGATLLYDLSTNPGVETTLGTLVASQVSNEGVPSTEFTLAWPFWVSLHNDPSPTNPVLPFAFAFGFGVTPFPQRGFNATLTTLLDQGINYAGQGSEGGISNVILRNGTTMDKRQFNYWYSVDWAQIHADEDISNAIINGSNNPGAPLYYNQAGINFLQDVVVSTMKRAIAFGLATGTVTTTTLSATDFQQNILAGDYDGKIVVNAVPFTDYLTLNPGDYAIGRYSGLYVNYLVQTSFISIVFNLNVTDFLVA